MPDFFALLIGVILVAAPAYVIGWATGVGSLRYRNRRFEKAINDYRKQMTEWTDRKSDQHSDYWMGYSSGVQNVLQALHSFLATFEEDEEDTDGSS